MAINGMRPIQNSKMANILDFLEPNPDSFNYRSIDSVLIPKKHFLLKRSGPEQIND